MPDTKKFDWRDLDPEDYVVRSVQAVAVYINGEHDVVIRQEAHALEEDDSYVIFPTDLIDPLIERLEKLKSPS